ncbi:MAG: tetratricopeptide repeat protein, partial [Chloroflexi bacterium]|nr:tetratricopeptide repeat protein [Chloroflexota bacterium]
MNNSSLASADSITKRINRLLRELQQAIQHDRHALLLAIYSSEYVRTDVETALAAQLQKAGQKVERVFINAQLEDLPFHLRNRADKQKTVFFVSGLRFGGGTEGRNAYRALNIRREYFLEDQLRVVFWLTESEARALPNFAPDFWAFRHRVVEFMESPTKEQIQQHSRELAFRDLDNKSSQKLNEALLEDTLAKIAYREQMLAELPESEENQEIKVDILSSLALLYAAAKNHIKALDIFNELLSKVTVTENPNRNFITYNNRGITYHDQGKFDLALADYSQAINLNPEDASAFYNRGITYHDQGKFDLALDDYSQAINLNP